MLRNQKLKAVPESCTLMIQAKQNTGQNKETPEAKTTTRLLLLAVALFTWMLVIFFRLAWLQIARHDEFVAHAAKNQQKEVAVKAPRGEITDRREVPFAQTVLRESLYADPRMLKQDNVRTAFVKALAAPLGYQEPELTSLLNSNSPGGVWTPPGIPIDGVADPESVIANRMRTLTPQQMRVLMMLGEGLLNKQIAYKLDVSEATVKAHVSAILQKLSVDSRTQAVIALNKLAANEPRQGLDG